MARKGHFFISREGANDFSRRTQRSSGAKDSLCSAFGCFVGLAFNQFPAKIGDSNFRQPFASLFRRVRRVKHFSVPAINPMPFAPLRENSCCTSGDRRLAAPLREIIGSQYGKTFNIVL